MDRFKILFIFLLLLPFSAVSGRTFLVSAGIADYPGTKNDLRLPVRDAKTIAAVYGLNKNSTYKLLLNEKATTQNIQNAMISLFAKAEANDIVVFFFSGHGCKQGFVAYDGVLSYSAIRNAMSKSKCKNKMIFADACFSGKLRSGNSNAETSQAKKANVMLFLSSRNGEVSMENPSMKNGFFTSFLQKGLRGKADVNMNSIITAKELYNYVHKHVIEISHDKQHPVMWGKFSDNMPVIIWN